jgi:transcriptional regulator with XRE-family HTH domain
MSEESAGVTPRSSTAASSNADGESLSVSDMAAMLYRWRKASELTLEQTGEKIGVSAATLSRLERQRNQSTSDETGKASFVPDVRTLAAVARWLGVSLARVAGLNGTEMPAAQQENNKSVPEEVEAHLRADRNLDDESALALSKMFRMAYEQFTRISQASAGKGDEMGPNSGEGQNG